MVNSENIILQIPLKFHYIAFLGLAFLKFVPANQNIFQTN